MKAFLYNNPPDLEILLKKRGLHLVDQQQESFAEVDLMIANYKNNDAQFSYLTALALAQKKPIICLVKKGLSLDESIQKLSENKDLANLLLIAHYTDANLEKTILEVLAKIEGVAINEVPSIKFTLRITPSMERYLQWKSQSTGLTKADFLRDFLQKEVIDKDSQYRAL